MRVLIFHGYLLGGTGSNVYNAQLAQALVRLGHEVHLISQERRPEQLPFVDAAADWDGGALRVRRLQEPRGHGSCTVYRPDIDGLLLVYVADRYEGLEARTFAEASDSQVEAYVAANVRAAREVAALVRPERALANHLVMGPAILARALEGRVPYAVKVHGSALEYTVKPQPERFLPYAREGLAGAHGVLVGSRHTALSLWQALQDPAVVERTRLGPPGVDVEQFVPREPDAAAAGVRALAERLAAAAPAANDSAAPAAGDSAAPNAFARDTAAAARAVASLEPGRERLVAFVGKLIVSKGVDLLAAAWPLVLAEVPDARLVVVGFGAYREGLEELLAALGGGQLEAVAELARAGRAREGGPAGQPLRHLLAFVDGLSGAERDRYVAAAKALPSRVVLTGRLEHDELAELLPACEAVVVPSTFPEAFGMVAAEAAACGALPVSAGHSGLAEVSEVLARALPQDIAPCLSFPVDDGAVRALTERIVDWLRAGGELRAQAREALVATVRERWSWEGVARGVLAAAAGELEGLAKP